MAGTGAGYAGQGFCGPGQIGQRLQTLARPRRLAQSEIGAGGCAWATSDQIMVSFSLLTLTQMREWCDQVGCRKEVTGGAIVVW
jgi:hypothetical protein